MASLFSEIVIPKEKLFSREQRVHRVGFQPLNIITYRLAKLCQISFGCLFSIVEHELVYIYFICQFLP